MFLLSPNLRKTAAKFSWSKPLRNFDEEDLFEGRTKDAWMALEGLDGRDQFLICMLNKFNKIFLKNPQAACRMKSKKEIMRERMATGLK